MAKDQSSSSALADAGAGSRMRFFDDGVSINIDDHLRKKHGSDIIIPVIRFEADRTEGFDIDPAARNATGNAKLLAGFFGDLLDTALGSKNGGNVSQYETTFALGTKEIIVNIGDDVFVYAPDNHRAISVTARDDVFIYAPGNDGSITARGDDVFAFVSGNEGALQAFARSVADATAKAKGSAYHNDDISAVGKAKSEADAYTFIYAKDNSGLIYASADSDATATADAQANASRGDAKAVAVAEADAEARILVYAPGSGRVTTSGDADAVATAKSVAESSSGDAEALSDTLAVAAVQTDVILDHGGYDHYFFA